MTISIAYTANTGVHGKAAKHTANSANARTTSIKTVQFLGMSVVELCGINNGRVVRFMFHDRVSFGGTLIATDLMYLWLAAFPLAAGEAWA